MDQQENLFFKPSQWLEFLNNGLVEEKLGSIYGSNFDITEKIKRLKNLFATFSEEFGDQPCLVSRAPGRLNIMGRHVDHQGGYGNMIALANDVYMLVAPKSADRSVRVRSTDPNQFSAEDFQIDDLLDESATQNWRDFVDSQFVQQYNTKFQKKWSIYLKSIIACFQAKYPEIPIKGMDIVVAGDVPIAAGLSSSSTLVVALGEAIMAINKIDLSDQKFVELCGEGEWFVGTRGGAGDHAAMKFSKKGKIVQIGFFPLSKSNEENFPPGYSMVVCNSKMNAKKTAGAKDKFNQRVACYHFGKALLNKELSKRDKSIQHLRDFNGEYLELSPAELIEIIKSLPIEASIIELETLLEKEQIDQIVKTFGIDNGTFPIRSVVIYGLTECDRSKNAPNLCASQSCQTFGNWMNTSHDGDRVEQADGSPFIFDASDEALNNMLLNANPKLELASVPGGYGCSIPQIDKMVDIALDCPGVMGAQISGAGLGGCIMVFVKNEHIDELKTKLIQEYYIPSKVEPSIITSQPVAGSGLLKM